MDRMFKAFNSDIKSIDEKEMTLTAFISTDAVDRMREVLDPAGVDLRNYKKNPVVLWAHSYETPPIGKALWVKREGNGIVSKVKFANTPFAQEIFQLYKEGFLKAFSVGFIPTKAEVGKDDEYDDPKKPRRIFRNWEMLEYSAVPVPANPEAISLAFSKGMIKDEALKKSLESFMAEAPVQEFNHEQEQPKEEKEVIKESVEEKENNVFFEDYGKALQRIEELEKENAEIKYKLYQAIEQLKKHLSEITAQNLVKEIEEITRRVIRKAQGKLD